ncbi:DNA polymerase III subunit alpha [Pseudorhodoplanes sinuspersici]|uniref:DNA polymerase III subunit alpha n=1 Tax=Pseudorhodoplanes sinuspersici TaxID=1235591 RepID=A0A1W6ZWE6_9HYPH|nr:DNA polymerase III subunit alpha [Pseudorhodoplanes sinuspersici]ARQ01636.1 DNA polymerase III subunit alpha [Pseudorhodoplanes sinuspersici]RKE73356.1 DNA polymerase III alpha subunit [Pseudorhodoplanes sinuspersici]
MSDAPFVHLHVHSSYSLLEGALKIGRLADLAKADKQPALALTDTDNMFGALEFSEKMASSGVQPIVGTCLSIDFGDQPRDPRNPLQNKTLPRIVLLAARQDGYRRLMRLSSRAFLETPSNEAPHIHVSWLDQETDGIIALTGGGLGVLDQAIVAGRLDLAQQRSEQLRVLFGNRLYVEIQRHGLPEQRLTEGHLLDIAYGQSLPLVATNEPFFATPDDYESHDALICIAEGRIIAENERRKLTPEHYFKSRKEMAKLFSDLPEAIANTAEIAQRCSYRPRKMNPILPRFSTAEAVVADEATELRQQAEQGLERRIAAHGMARGFSREDYARRLDIELGVIERMKFPGYFLIVSDFIKWAKSQDIPVGPGRGSGAGSLVAYSLTITDLDPMRFGLLFERFLNEERISMPDFDIDFCQDRRDEVIRYVQERYGRDQVAQIITFGTLQARGVLRDVGRVLEMPYGQVDKLCKLVPQNPANPVTLARAIDDEPKLQAERDANPTVRRAFDIARKLEGLTRHASTHAAGIVIGDRPLAELVPLYRDPKSDMPVTQFNMKWVEPAGLVKFDFLGLKTLTVLKTAVDLLKRRGVELDLAAIALDDKKTYDLLARAEAVGIFQLESQGMRRALLDMKPDRFEDIIALVALYRPGPMANIPTYCARKHGDEEPDYIHPKLEEVLKETFGVIVYQEQVMQAAQLLAGYTLGEADNLRRAMGKKIRSEMQAQRERFVTGCVARDIAKSQADAIFDLLERFAEYGFNKSHAAAYALVAYQTAYMKANYPVEFLAASMTLDMGNTDKLSEFRGEAERLGLKLEPPSINRSREYFDVEGSTIFYSLAALKGVGKQAVESIVASRGDKPFRDLSDFASRLNPRAVNKRVLESLAAAGAFDKLDSNRAGVHAAVETMLSTATRTHDAAVVGQNELFGGPSHRETLRIPAVEPWMPSERLQREYEAIGFFLTGHPLDDYANALKRMKVLNWSEFSKSVLAGANAGRTAATVVSRMERRTKTGNKMGIIGLSDPTGQYEAILFQEGLQQYRDLLEPGSAVLLFLTGEAQGEEVRARIQSVERLDQAAEKVQKSLQIFLRDPAPLDHITNRLEPKGDGEVRFVLMLSDGGEVEIKLPGRYKVSPQIAGAIKAVPGVVTVEAA